MAEGRGKAQAETLRQARGPTWSRARVPADGGEETVPASDLRMGDLVLVVGRRARSRRRRHRRGHRLGRRVGDHRRVRAGDPRVGRRPLAPSPAARRCSRTGSWSGSRREPGRDVPRPHDRAGRGRRAAEDAERDRAVASCSSKFTIIFLIVVVTLQPFAIYVGHARCSDHRADRAVRLPDPDDDRRAALRDRHRRDGPPGPAQRAGDERAGRRGGRRRRRAAARQDRARSRSATARRPRSSRAGRRRARAGGGRPDRLARRRDAGGPLDRGAGEGALRPARARAAWSRTPSSFRSRPRRG